MPKRLLVLAGLLAAGLMTAAAAAQRPEPSEEADGRIHVSLTLEAQEVSVAFPPDQAADDAAHRALLGGTVGARARVGTLEGHRALRIGTLAPDLETPPAPPEPRAEGEPPPPSPSHELWLTRTAQGWELEAHASADGAVHVIPLTHRATTTAAPTFTASLRATAAEEGRLALRWGRHAWSTGFRFDQLPPAPRPPRVSGRGQEREADTDTRAFSRGTTLAERNESALVLPDGARIQMLYWKGIDVEDEDYARLGDTPDGAVVSLVRAPPLRLKSDVPLRVGRVEVPTGNLAPGFAGAYAVWLQKTGDAWRLVFNNEPDSWGTQYNSEFDAGTLDVAYTRTEGAFRPLGATLVPTGADRGRLVVHWGPHEWAAEFMIIGG